MNAGLCNHCGAVVDLHDTLKDQCPECGQTGNWNDSPDDVARVVAARSDACMHGHIDTPCSSCDWAANHPVPPLHGETPVEWEARRAASCIVCGKPRDGGRIWCGDDACLEIVKAMPTEEINAIRQREAIEAWQQHPMPADGRGVCIHITPRKE